MKKNIDVIFSVIDNYGDMGFTAELLIGFEKSSPDIYHFTIWTDNIDAVERFFALNQEQLPSYSIQSRQDFGKMRKSQCAFALFHAPIPDQQYFEQNSLVLRVDYLSFDPVWNQYHESEHISSTPSHRVIELIPSVFPNTWGIIFPELWSDSRENLASEFGLDISKKWISIFAYSDTLLSVLEFDAIPGGTQILLFGHTTSGKIREKIDSENVVFLPFVNLNMFHHLIAESIWSIVRGEVSFVSTVAIGKPFFWDMYQEIGGFHALQSEQFLESFSANEKYRDIHARLNRQKEGRVFLSELSDCMEERENMPTFPLEHTNNLIVEIKKYIDRFDFSL